MEQFKILFFSFSNFVFSLPFTMLGLTKYDQNDIKADWQPPGFVFGIVWPILYFLFGIINLNAYFGGHSEYIKRKILNNAFHESLVQTCWLLVTSKFYEKRLFIQNFLGFFIILYLVYYAYFVRAFNLLNIKKGNLLYYYVPYCLWISFALILSIQILSKSLISINTNT